MEYLRVSSRKIWQVYSLELPAERGFRNHQRARYLEANSVSCLPFLKQVRFHSWRHNLTCLCTWLSALCRKIFGWPKMFLIFATQNFLSVHVVQSRRQREALGTQQVWHFSLHLNRGIGLLKITCFWKIVPSKSEANTSYVHNYPTKKTRQSFRVLITARKSWLSPFNICAEVKNHLVPPDAVTAVFRSTQSTTRQASREPQHQICARGATNPKPQLLSTKNIRAAKMITALPAQVRKSRKVKESSGAKNIRSKLASSEEVSSLMSYARSDSGVSICDFLISIFSLCGFLMYFHLLPNIRPALFFVTVHLAEASNICCCQNLLVFTSMQLDSDTTK